MHNREQSKSIPIVVAAAIIQQEEKILLTRRKPDSVLGGFWEFPGGKQEPGETLECCLRREVKEELGVEIGEPQVFHSLRYQYPEQAVELHFFTCSIIQGHPQPLDCAEIAWVHKAELISYEFPPADISVLTRLLQAEDFEESSPSF
jgi:mutator protein MutT